MFFSLNHSSNFDVNNALKTLVFPNPTTFFCPMSWPALAQFRPKSYYYIFLITILSLLPQLYLDAECDWRKGSHNLRSQVGQSARRRAGCLPCMPPIPIPVLFISSIPYGHSIPTGVITQNNEWALISTGCAPPKQKNQVVAQHTS